MFLHVCVILFGEAGSASVRAGMPPPQPGPPRPGTPLARQIPRTRHPPGPGTPLRSACWEIRSTSGRYASYWNSILVWHDFCRKLQENEKDISLDDCYCYYASLNEYYTDVGQYQIASRSTVVMRIKK